VKQGVKLYEFFFKVNHIFWAVSMVNRVLIIIFAFWCPFAASAQYQPFFGAITSKNGLCNDFIRSIHQDKSGFLWLGTYDGLSRFDGRNFLTFRRNLESPQSLPSNTILDIAEDDYDVLWLSTGKGICYLDKQTRTIHRISICPDEPVFYSYEIKTADNDLWLTSQKALYQFNITGKGKVKLRQRYAFPDSVLNTYAHEKIFIDKARQVFVLKDHILYQVKGSKLVVAPVRQGNNNVRVQSVCQDDDGAYWVSDANAPKLLQLDASFRVTGVVTIPLSISGATGRADQLFFTKQGIESRPRILAAMSNGGLLVVRTDDKSVNLFRHLPQQSGSISNNEVHCFFQTEDGIIWIGTAYGLSYYDWHMQQLRTASLWSSLEAGDRLTDVIPDMADSNQYWVGTVARGLIRYSLTTQEKDDMHLPRQAGAVQYLYQAKDGTLFIGCEKGLYLRSKTGQITKAGLLGKVVSISCVLELDNGNYLVSSFEDGCYLVNLRENKTTAFTTAKGLFSNRCTYLSIANNKVYITHIATGISIMNLADFRIQAIDLQPYLEKELTYPATFTYCSLPQGDSLIWLGTGLGLMKFNLKKHEGGLVPATTRLQTDNEIWSVIPDKYPMLWLKTTFGIYKYNQITSTIVSFFSLNRENIPAQEGYFRMRRLHNNLLLPAYNSFCFFRTGLRAADPLKQVELLDVKVNGKPIPLNNYSRGLNVSLKPEERNLELNFVAINFRNTEYTRYAYYMEGSDEQWFDLGNRNSLSFANLKAGDYTLKIKATDFEGRETSVPLLVRIHVAPFFWQTPWFFLVVILFLVALFYAAYRYRLRQLLATQRVRLKISKDLHDDIGATISSIGILSSMAKEKVVDEQKKQQFIERIAKDSKYVSEALSDIVWAINPRNDSLEMIFARLLRYAYELFEAKNISYTVSVPEEEIREIYLNMDSRQHLYLIVKEVINNLVKYSRATEASILVTYQKPCLTVVINDNGVGFDTELTGGNGLQNIRKRAAELKGSVAIESRSGFGTTITLNVPVRKYQKM